MEYEKDMTGVLFVNNDRKNDKQPNLKGRVIIRGEKFWLSAWTKTSEKAGEYISLAVAEVKTKKTVQDRLNDERKKLRD